MRAFEQPALLHTEGAINYVAYRRQVFAIPQSVGPVDIQDDNRVRDQPSVLVGNHIADLRRKATVLRSMRGKLQLVPMTNTPTNVAWFGASHPAYQPIFAGKYDNVDVHPAPSSARSDDLMLCCLDRSAKRFRTEARTAGISDDATDDYIETRGYESLLVQEAFPGVHWFQGAPQTIGASPWVVQVETSEMLWAPSCADQTTRALTKENDIFKLARMALLSPQCVGIVTNIAATQKLLPVLFDAPELAEKIHHLPFCVPAQPKWPKTIGRFLFTTSWHQHENSFYNRGGVDALLAFGELSRRFRNLELVVRCRPPNTIPPEAKAVLALPNVKVIDQKLTSEEMLELFARAEYYLLPAGTLHSMSTIEAMAHGCICVLADAWGNDEYLHDGANGIRLAGREGKQWNANKETGLISEDYSGMRQPNVDLVRAMVTRISELIINESRRSTMSRAARDYVATHHSVKDGQTGFARIMASVQDRLHQAL